MRHVKIMSGYEIHSNIPLPQMLLDAFDPRIAMLLKPYIRQYYFKVAIQKEWGMSQTQCYERCLDHDIMAFGLTVPHKRYIVLSVIGHRATLNFQKYYHIYTPLNKQMDIFLMFPFTMILKLDIDQDVSCDVCGHLGTYAINSETYCMNRSCSESRHRLSPRDFSFGKLVLSLDDILEYRFRGADIDERKMKCKHCRANKVHKICSFDRLTKKIKCIRDQILS